MRTASAPAGSVLRLNAMGALVLTALVWIGMPNSPDSPVADAAMLSIAVEHAAGYGLTFMDRRLDVSQLQQWTEQVSDALTTQLERSCTERGIEVIRGVAEFDRTPFLISRFS